MNSRYYRKPNNSILPYSQTSYQYKTIDSPFSSTYQPPLLYPTAYSKFLSSSRESSSPYFVPHDSSDLTITTKTLDDIINSVISNEKRIKYESKLFLPLHNLIFFSNSPKRTSDFPYYQNSFVIFRKDYQAQLADNQGHRSGSFLEVNPRNIVRSARLIWKNMPSEDKYMYEQLLSCNNRFHDILWSNYVYRSSRNIKCNYEYAHNGTIKDYSPSFFVPISQRQHVMATNHISSMCPRGLALDPPITFNSSYDKYLKDSIDKNINLL